MTIFLFAPWELQIHRMLTKLHAGYMMCEISRNFFERFTSLSEIGFFSFHSIHCSLSYFQPFAFFFHPTAFSWTPSIYSLCTEKVYQNLKFSCSYSYFPADIFFFFAFLSFVIFLSLPTRSFIYCDVFLRRSPPESTRYVRIMRWFMTSRLSSCRIIPSKIEFP